MVFNNNRLLLEALINLDSKRAISIIQEGNYDPNLIIDDFLVDKDFNSGENILIYSIKIGLNDVALLLINNPNTDLNYKSKLGITALFYAIGYKRRDILIALVSQPRCDTGLPDKNNITPLLLSLIKSNKDYAMILLSNPKSVPLIYTFKGEDTVLIYALDKGFEDIADKIIDTGYSNPSHANRIGFTALFVATVKRFTNIIIKLLNLKNLVLEGKIPGLLNKNLSDEELNRLTFCNPAAITIDTNYTALMVSLAKDKDGNISTEIANILLDSGMELNVGQVNYKNETALYHATLNNLTEISLKIIKTGQSNPGQASIKTSYTPLIYACYYKNFEIAKAIIDTGESNSGHICDKENTALQISISNFTQNTQIALYLLEKEGKKCLPFFVFLIGTTMLMYALENNAIDVANKLIDFYVGDDAEKINAQNNMCCTALNYAIIKKQEEIAKKIFLFTGKADPYIPDITMNNAYDNAKKNEYNDLVELFINSNFKLERIYIPFNITVLDNISQNEYKIGDWLELDKNNIVIAFPNNSGNETLYLLLNKEELRSNLTNKVYYPCLLDNGNQSDKNVNIKLDLFNGRSFGFYDYIIYHDVLRIIFDKINENDIEMNDMNKEYSNRLFWIKKVNCEPVKSVVNRYAYNNVTEYLRRRIAPPAGCTPGKGGNLYRLFPALPNIKDYVKKTPKEINTELNRINKRERDEENTAEGIISNQSIIKVKIKENEIYEFPIDNNTSIGNIKEKLLEKIIEKGENRNPTIRMFILFGKNYSNTENDSIKIMELPNYQNGLTFSPVIIGRQNGGKQKTRKLKKQNKTIKIKKRMHRSNKKLRTLRKYNK